MYFNLPTSRKGKIGWIVFSFILYGGLIILEFYLMSDILVLQGSHELVEGTIDKIKRTSSGKSSSYYLICSYTYEGNVYNKEIHVSAGIPFITSISKEYPKGKTIFMLNVEKDIVFPKKQINMEMRRQSVMLIFFGLLLLVSALVFGKRDERYF
jgi:hypothetical protein